MNYESDNYWRKIQAYLPLNNRITSETQEYFISLKNYKIHIDHYKVNYFKR